MCDPSSIRPPLWSRRLLLFLLWVHAASLLAATPTAKRQPLSSPVPDPTNAEAVMRAANTAYAAGDFLRAGVLYQRVLSLLPDDPLAAKRLADSSPKMQAALDRLTPTDLTSHEQFAASMLYPEDWKRLSAQRLAMAELLRERQWSDAMIYATRILALLPHDAEATSVRMTWLNQMESQIDAARAQGDLQTASTTLAQVQQVFPTYDGKGSRDLPQILSQRDQLAKAVHDDDERTVRRLYPSLLQSIPNDPVVRSATGIVNRPPGARVNISVSFEDTFPDHGAYLCEILIDGTSAAGNSTPYDDRGHKSCSAEVSPRLTPGSHQITFMLRYWEGRMFGGWKSSATWDKRSDKTISVQDGCAGKLSSHESYPGGYPRSPLSWSGGDECSTKW